MGVPVLDASLFNGDETGRKACINDLIQAFQDYGFVRLRNHGVPQEQVRHMFELAGKLFAKENSDKLSFSHVADGSPQRGYSAIGQEKTAALYGVMTGQKVNKDVTDAREHFDCGPPGDSEFENRWPSDMPGFQSSMEDFYNVMAKCTANIMAALEEGLNVPTGTFNSKITKEQSASELRLNHYPATSAGSLRGETVARIWPHFDLGVISLLFTSAVGGLEVEDRNASQPKTFIPVVASDEAELIVNVSETLQRWTNDVLPAGLHRVTIPRELETSSDVAEIPARYSIAYFCKADRQASSGTLPPFAADSPPKYEDVTAAAYHRRRLVSAY